MKFPMDRPVKVVMLGAGGTGGYVAPYLFRLLHMLDRPARFIICDGDLVEAKNLDRQNFVEADLGENKARVLSERYSAVLGMETEYVPNFIETLSELMTLIEPGEWETDDYPRRKVREMVLLLGCVDNNRTRQLCHEAFKKSLVHHRPQQRQRQLYRPGGLWRAEKRTYRAKTHRRRPPRNAEDHRQVPIGTELCRSGAGRSPEHRCQCYGGYRHPDDGLQHPDARRKYRASDGLLHADNSDADGT